MLILFCTSEIIEMLTQLFIHGFDDESFASTNDLEISVDKTPDLKQDLVDYLHTEPSEDPFYDDAVSYVKESKKASVSSLQRRLRIGYNRAARLIEEMEQQGIVTEPQHNGAREVIIN